jgi:hypothetical protein
MNGTGHPRQRRPLPYAIRQALDQTSYTQMLWMGVKREAAYSPGF